MKAFLSKVRSGGRFGIATSMALCLAACDRSPGPEAQRPEPTLRGASLVVGTSADQWTLVSVPSDGGLAEARELSDLQRVVWTGTTELPASVELRAIPGGRLVLRTGGGVVYTYDPQSDDLAQVGEVSPEATWVGDGTAGLYVSPDGTLLEISRDGAWSYALDREVAWAAPADGGVLVAVEDDAGRRTLWLLRRDETEPAETGTAPVESPGVMTAWGRRAILTSSTGRGLIVLTVGPIETAGEVDLGGSVSTLAASPSTHEIYAALDDPPRLVAINRFNLASRSLAELPAPATSLRPSLFGEGVLVAQEGQASWVPVSGGRPVALGTTWRGDLPIGLPNGRVVGAGAGKVVVVEVGTGAQVELEGAGEGRWWSPVHWNPATAIVSMEPAQTQASRTEPRTGAESEIDSATLAERRDAAPGLRDEPRAPVESGPPTGFYAIVGSARQPAGIQSLVQSLEDAGFATQTQRFPDEAGRTWYRGLVGPYRSRSEAEAAARQLLRERRLEAWVTEVGAGRPEEESI